MESALFVGAVVVAGLACPAMMWWNGRRGREACCVPDRGRDTSPSVEELHRRRDELTAAIAEQSEGSPAARPSRAPVAARSPE